VFSVWNLVNVILPAHRIWGVAPRGLEYLCPRAAYAHWDDQESNYFSASGSETELTFQFLARPLRKVAAIPLYPHAAVQELPNGFSCNSVWAALELEYVNPNGEDKVSYRALIYCGCVNGNASKFL